jgi:purine-nucleoside phosphorylase
MSNYKDAADFIKKSIKFAPEVGLILGSGLNELASEIEEPIYINYKDIPHFPDSTAPGHKGRLVIGQFQGRNVITMQGRFHHYEGYSMDIIAFPIRVMTLLGVDSLIVTNAAGGVNTNFNPGDLMLISDHIKMAGGHPLMGPNQGDFGVRFPDMSDAYNKDLRVKVKEAAKLQGI